MYIGSAKNTEQQLHIMGERNSYSKTDHEGYVYAYEKKTICVMGSLSLLTMYNWLFIPRYIWALMYSLILMILYYINFHLYNN